MKISVIICTHSPRLSYLRRVIGALQLQTLSTTEWELLIIDNASNRPIRQEINLDWHPSGRYIREEKVGLTHARLRGMSDSSGDLLVFVDDDNVLKLDYLGKALEIAQLHPMLGAWSGQVLPEFEATPPEELQHFLGVLCIRKLEQDLWGNQPAAWAHLPSGAGMCVRREVANRYRKDVSNNPVRLSLGHAGDQISCHDDTDLAITSIDMGLGTGLFRDLTLTHLIPERRLKESYLLKLVENSAEAFVVLRRVRGLRVEDELKGVKRWVERLEYLRATPAQKKVADARMRGEKKGRALTADLPKPQPPMQPACPI